MTDQLLGFGTLADADLQDIEGGALLTFSFGSKISFSFNLPDEVDRQLSNDISFNVTGRSGSAWFPFSFSIVRNA